MGNISSKYKVIITYIIFGFLWIFFSDQLLAALVKDIDKLNTIQSYKGWFFILLTALLLYFLINLYEKERNKYEKELRQKDILLIQQSKMAAMGEMIDNIAHQWKQPLNMISLSNGLVRLNQGDEKFNSKKEIDEAINNIDNGVKHLTSTIDDFRNFFNPDKTKKEFLVSNCVERVLILVKSKLKNRNINVIKNIEDITIVGVENEFVQVLMNLISNSIDALDRIEENSKCILIDAHIKHEHLIITVKDNAGGVPQKIINKIFEPRFTTKEEGTGIGLYMSRNIINSYKGSLSVENIELQYNNTKFKGASFILCVPIK